MTNLPLFVIDVVCLMTKTKTSSGITSWMLLFLLVPARQKKYLACTTNSCGLGPLIQNVAFLPSHLHSTCDSRWVSFKLTREYPFSPGWSLQLGLKGLHSLVPGLNVARINLKDQRSFLYQCAVAYRRILPPLRGWGLMGHQYAAMTPLVDGCCRPMLGMDSRLPLRLERGHICEGFGPFLLAVEGRDSLLRSALKKLNWNELMTIKSQ